MNQPKPRGHKGTRHEGHAHLLYFFKWHNLTPQTWWGTSLQSTCWLRLVTSVKKVQAWRKNITLRETQKKRSVSKKVIYRSSSASARGWKKKKKRGRKKPQRSLASRVVTLQTYQAVYNTSKIKLVAAGSFVSARVKHSEMLSETPQRGGRLTLLFLSFHPSFILCSESESRAYGVLINSTQPVSARS